MKHTDFYNINKKLIDSAMSELKKAVEAHGGEYIFYNPEDPNDDDSRPEVEGFAVFWGGIAGNFFVSRVKIVDDNVKIFGCRQYEDYTDCQEVEIKCFDASSIADIIDIILETENVADVSIKQNNSIDPFTAINKFIFYGWNFKSVEIDVPHGKAYAPEFIAKVKWTCPIAHMYSKWVEAYKVADCSGALVQFYANLDNENRRLLVDWIMENYKS